jgi:putative membrane protein
VSDAEKLEPVDPRILFAAERTLFAYIRTGLALMGFGFVVARFGLFLRQLSDATGTPLSLGRPTGFSGLIGIALVLCGVGLCAYAPIWFQRTVQRLERGEPYAPSRFGLASAIAALIAVVGVFMAVYLYLLH